MIILAKFEQDAQPSPLMLMNLYVRALPQPMVAFLSRARKAKLAEMFNEV